MVDKFIQKPLFHYFVFYSFEDCIFRIKLMDIDVYCKNTLKTNENYALFRNSYNCQEILFNNNQAN